MRVVTPGEMAEIDRTAVNEAGVDGSDLMERAGAHVAAAARDMLSARGGRRVAILCGKGNNGGDGLVAARLLSGDRADVVVFLLAPTDDLSPDARSNFDRLEGTQVEVLETRGEKDLELFTRADPPFDIVIDAIFGTGFQGKAAGLFERAIGAVNDAACPVLSVDIPSGVAGGTGAVEGAAVLARRTVTFAALKVGLVQYPGASMAGTVEVVDIGIPWQLLERVPESRIFTVEPREAESMLPVRRADTHKRECGSVLVVGGSPGLTGAASLCSRAALRAGAGLVTLGIPQALNPIFEVKLTEVMTRPLPQAGDGGLAESALPAVMELCDNADVLALGPGLGTGRETMELVRSLIEQVGLPIVLDADGLNAMVGHTGLFTKRGAPLVVTPHPGEMGRLVGKTGAEVQADRLATATEAACEWGAVVVLKGAGTLVAEPGGTVSVNTTGNPGMATAGMGDVLTGCIAAMIGQGLGAFEAAVAGVYFHGYAADLAAHVDAMVGMVAGDVIRHLPLAMRRGSEGGEW